MKKLLRNAAMLFAMGAIVLTSCKDDEPETTTDNTPVETTGYANIGGEISADRTLSADTIYTMTEKVWVVDDAVLTIEAGTIVKAATNTDPADAVALVVTPGAKLMAEGTAAEPIIFTTALDDIDFDQTSTLTSSTYGKWGGIVLMGKAEADTKDEVNGVAIEGIEAGDARGVYGTEKVANDNSGTLKYVSIRHGGATVIGDSELNGLSLYAVGSGTTIEYVEVFANDDDGIEFFGGDVEVDHAIVTHVTDDSYDWDQGWTGGGQYWLAIQFDGSDKGFECDGGEGDKDPNSIPTISNFTLIGQGTSTAMDLKSSTGGNLSYGIVYNFANGIQYNGATASDLTLSNIAVSASADSVAAYYDLSDNSDLTGESYVTNVAAATFSSLSYSSSSVDVIPTSAEAGTPYKGAFDPTATTTWASSWTKTWEVGIID